jgi:hypothetical protein
LTAVTVPSTGDDAVQPEAARRMEKELRRLSGTSLIEASVSRAFPSWERSILTEIYLCGACSYREIDDGNAPARGSSPSSTA